MGGGGQNNAERDFLPGNLEGALVFWAVSNNAE